MTALATFSDVEAVTALDLGVDQVHYVERLIELVSAAVVRYTGQAFTQIVDDTITIRPHDGFARLPQHPVTAVSSITVYGQVLDASLYSWAANGVLHTLAVNGWDQMARDANWYGWNYIPIDENGWRPYPITVVYTHGYPDGQAPDDVSLVVAEVVAAKLLGGERQANGVISEMIDTYRVQYYKNEPTGAWLPEHKMILDSYRRSKFASVRLG